MENPISRKFNVTNTNDCLINCVIINLKEEKIDLKERLTTMQTLCTKHETNHVFKKELSNVSCLEFDA